MEEYKRYRVLSINAEKLISSASLSYHIGQSTEPPVYSVDLNTNKASYCCSADYRPDNALFYQIRECAKTPHDSQDALFENIIFVDFATYFDFIPSSQVPKILEQITNDSASPYSQADHLKRIFSLDQGITVKYKDGKEIQFVVFDKSSSMARHSKVSFIRKSLYDEVNEKLTLGLPFDQLDMQLSKYFAYRGLYLSTSERIPEDADKFVLNEETVIVVKDFEHTLQSDIQEETQEKEIKNANESKSVTEINAFPPQYTVVDDSQKDENGEVLHKFGERRKSYESNAFDGEGLIAPEYVEYINNVLFPVSDADMERKVANSFQIRYPFTKGMLHNVDFHEFFREYVKDTDPVIKDCFDIPRHINKAKIILTESMFKCKKWLKEAWEKDLIDDLNCENADPMKVFFDRARERKHTLYISDDDTTLNKSGKERLNYQFLSTLKVESSDFDKMVEEHFTFSKDAIIATFNPKKCTETTEPIIAVASKNHKFYAEPQILSKAERYLKNARIDCGMGSLRTRGTNKYLSADLLQFLIYISKGFLPKDRIEYQRMRDACLTSNSYMPGKSQGSATFAILRNPHLSQNEDCLSSPNNNQEDQIGKELQQDIYEKYFGKLDGVIMIPEQNLVPMTLGGADFDGDHAKIYYNKHMCRAIAVACYYTDPKYQTQGLIRKTPIVNIPSEDADPTYITTPTNEVINTKLLINTFSNQTGLISNLALSFALEEYRYTESPISFTEDFCAQATAITGLEIDAAKKGKHPIADIRHLQNEVKVITQFYKGKKFATGQYFTSCKNALKPLKNQSYKIEQNDDGSYRLIRYSKKDKDIIIGKPEDGSHNLLRLPFIFAEREYKADDRQAAKEILPSANNVPYYFAFEEKQNWLNDLDSEKQQSVHNLILAYNLIKKDVKDYEKTINNIKFSKTYSKLSTLLKLKYDCNGEDLPQEISDLLDKSVNLIEEYLDNSSSAETAMHLLTKYQWHVVPKANREKVFRTIINIPNEAELDQAVVDFICDFSAEGYYLLYYIIKYIIQKHTESLTLEDIIGEEQIADNIKKNPYYEGMLALYDSQPDLLFREVSIIESDDEDDPEGRSAAHEIPWTKKLKEHCIIELGRIFIEDSDKINEKTEAENIPGILLDDEKTKLIAHTWVERGFESISTIKKHLSSSWKALDENGNFFWDVVPATISKESLLNNVYNNDKEVSK